jgi:hypothetical protein
VCGTACCCGSVLDAELILAGESTEPAWSLLRVVYGAAYQCATDVSEVVAALDRLAT